MTTIVPFVDLKSQFRALRSELVPRLTQVMEDASFILGPDVTRFEENFASYLGAGHCIGVGSGAAALELGMTALGIGPGDDVILPATTYIASALAVSAIGARPVFVDIDTAYLMDPELLDAALTPRTKAIMPVHLYGQAVPMDPIMDFARRRGLFVIEDAAQAHGAHWNGRRVGTFGNVGCFSFYPTKNLGAYGDAGAIVTDDAAIADRLRLLRDLGQPKKYEHVIKGWNSRLDSMQAVVLDVKLRHLDAWNAARLQHAAAYDARMPGLGITPPVRLHDEGHVYHLYVIEVDQRDRVVAGLRELGIQVGIHYPTPLYLQPAYAELNLGRGSFPRTERSAERVISLPMFAELTSEQIDRVVDALASFQPLVAA